MIQAPPPVGEEPITDIRVVAGDYYRAMGIPLLRGRTFNSRDTESSPNVFVVDDELVRRHFPGEDPIGKQISFDWGDIVARPRLSYSCSAASQPSRWCSRPSASTA